MVSRLRATWRQAHLLPKDLLVTSRLPEALAETFYTTANQGDKVSIHHAIFMWQNQNHINSKLTCKLFQRDQSWYPAIVSQENQYAKWVICRNGRWNIYLISAYLSKKLFTQSKINHFDASIRGCTFKHDVFVFQLPNRKSNGLKCVLLALKIIKLSDM